MFLGSRISDKQLDLKITTSTHSTWAPIRSNPAVSLGGYLSSRWSSAASQEIYLPVTLFSSWVPCKTSRESWLPSTWWSFFLQCHYNHWLVLALDLQSNLLSTVSCFQLVQEALYLHPHQGCIAAMLSTSIGLSKVDRAKSLNIFEGNCKQEKESGFVFPVS